MYSLVNKNRVFFVYGLILALAGHSAFGLDLALGKIPDDSALRTRIKDTWLSGNPDAVLAKPRVLYNLDGGGRVELRAEAGQTEFMVIFARELNGAANGNSGLFPGWAQGSWILTRRKDTGAATRIRVFLRSDFNTYVQFRPFSADKCFMDVVLYDAYAVHSMPLPVSLERLYTMPLTEVLNLAGVKFPRRYFEPDPQDYRDQRLLIRKVRERLPELQFADDGAIDQEGRYVYIETGAAQRERPGLNCSGFTKWLIDGILRPESGKRMAIPPLKAPFGERGSSYTDLWEELRDPFFGLDWIRNLASQAGTALRSPAFGSLNEIEVRHEPFSQVILRGKNNSVTYPYPGFLGNAGYGVEGLQALLYTLAIDEPGRFYLAAVNNEMGPPMTEENPRGTPRMRQYFHVMAFIPYFTENGVFQIAVFESAAETSISAFKNRYPVSEQIVNGERKIYPNGHCVNLVRVPVETGFDP
ncbi:MAG: hypothetical protein LBG95_04730 [Treponema sp.]|jgi:hypothetical protein|nr:hypothetical protein [Treponema sp.]